MNVLVELFPAASVAVTVTVVVPTAKSEPDAFEYVIVTGPTASVATADAKLTIAPDELVLLTVMFPGTEVITGGVVSRTVIVKVRVVMFPAPSFAVTVTIVVPIAKTVPDAFEYVIVTGPTASLAIAAA